jgi:hypothetical protein
VSDVRKELEDEKAEGLERRVAELERDRAELRRQLSRETSRTGELEVLLQRGTQLRPADQRVPSWVKPRRRSGAHVATPVLMLSDLHLDEVVDPAEMDGLNAFDRDIAHARLERTVNKTVDYLRRYTAGATLNGIVVALLGDIITGAIHEELAKTNESPVPDTIVHWVPALASALTYLADELGQVFVPCVDGNHDRLGKRIQYKQRALESFAWIIYHWLADTLRDDDRITFSISAAPEQIVPVYDTRFLLAHGDAPRGGGGIGGIWPPIVRWVTKKHDTLASQGRPFEYALIGHWHQEVWGANFVINGALKGYDEYARGNAFRFEPPKQCLFLVTPERGVSTRTAIFCE